MNTLLGNVKRAIDGTYHACDPKYVGRYLAEFASEAYWPYCCEPQPVLLPAYAGLQAYFRQVRELFLRPACVQAQFTSDDQHLATLW